MPERVATAHTVVLHKCEVETRGQLATACFFLFIVKAKIDAFALAVDGTSASLYACRDRRPDGLMSLRLPPYIRLRSFLHGALPILHFVFSLKQKVSHPYGWEIY
jgi:hypothetical protein